MAGNQEPHALGCVAQDTCPILPACLPGGRVPCLHVGRAHLDKLRLCDELEAIADALPTHVDRRKCLFLADTLVLLLRQSHAYEEEYIFPAFERAVPADAARARTVRRLKTEHVEDQCAAQDVADILFAVGHGAPVGNPEAFGFMLRALFEAMRRHIAFEREHIMPAIAAGPPR